MDRNRDSRKTSIVGSNGFNRRRHRTSSLRDSPDDDGGLELQESVRLRDRVKKDRDRERERDHRERERERDLKERSSRSRRRRLTSNKDDIGGDETSDESIDDEDDEDGKGTTSAGVRLLTPAVGSISNHHHHGYSSNFVQQGQNRKAFPPGSSSSKLFRSPPVWKSGDEMITVPIPRKARSASTKRSHDWISSSINNNNGNAGIEQTHRPGSSSPARPTPLPVVPMSPSSSNASMRKKLKPGLNGGGGGGGGLKFRPPKASPEPSSSNPEELEIEIAEVLYGMMTQSQGPSSKKEDSREVSRSNGDAKSRNLFPISDSATPSNPSLGPNAGSLSVVAPKRKRPRQVPESFGRSPQVKLGAADPPLKGDVSCSPNKPTVENWSNSNGRIESAPAEERRDLEAKIESSSLQEKESSATGRDESNPKDVQPTTVASSIDTVIQPNSTVPPAKEGQKYAKFEIDLMAPPPQARSSPERCDGDGISSTPAVGPMIDAAAIDSLKDKENYEAADRGTAEEEEEEEEAGTQKFAENKNGVIDLQLELEKPDKEVRNKFQQQQQSIQKQQLSHQLKAELPPLSEKSVSLPMTMASWPGGLAPMGYMAAPLQGVVSMDGNATHLQQPLLSSQPRPKRCATHCRIARNIQSLQQFMKIAPVWAGAVPGAASFFGPKACNLNGLLPGSSDLQGNLSLRSSGNAADKGQSIVSGVGKEKGNQNVSSSGDSMKQQIIIQQAISPVAAGNLLGPTFIFPLNQQPPVRPGCSAKLGAAGSNSDSTVASTMSFAYPSMAAANESQYVAILPNNGGYPFPIPNLGAPPPPQMMPLFNGSFYPSQMIHPSQMAQLIQAQPSGGSLSQKQHMLPRGSQNLRLPPQSFAVMPPSATNNSHSEKKLAETAAESNFSMSFGGTSGSEASRQNVFRVSEDAKSSVAVDSPSAVGEDGKQPPLFGKAVGVVGQSIAFARPELVDSASTTPANGSMAASSGANRSGSRPSNTSNSNIQAQSKVAAVTVNGSSIAAKFSGFPPNQSLPQWKSSPANKTQQQQHRSRGSPVQPHNTQISFSGGNQKTSSNSAQSQPQPPSPMMAASPTSSGSKMAPKTASVLGSNHPHIAKNQLLQQQQLFFSSPGNQSQSPHSSTASAGYYMPRRRPEQQQTPGTISSPLAVSVTAANDPANKAVVKGSVNASQFAAQSAGTVLPAGFSYLHPAAAAAAAVQVKPAEQKQSAG